MRVGNNTVNAASGLSTLQGHGQRQRLVHNKQTVSQMHATVSFVNKSQKQVSKYVVTFLIFLSSIILYLFLPPALLFTARR